MSEGSGSGGRERGKEAKGHGARPARDRTGETITDETRPAGGGMGMSKSGGAVASCAVTAEQSGAGAVQQEAAALRPCGKRIREANQKEPRRGRKGARGASSEPLGKNTKIIIKNSQEETELNQVPMAVICKRGI